jgi:hypothetical protein
MTTPEQEAKELEAKKQAALSNVVVITPTAKQASTLNAIISDKKALEDKLADNNKREADVVGLILDANGIDTDIVKEVQVQNGKIVAIKHPIEKSVPEPVVPELSQNGKH